MENNIEDHKGITKLDVDLFFLGVNLKYNLTNKLRNDGSTVVGEPRTTDDLYYESESLILRIIELKLQSKIASNFI